MSEENEIIDTRLGKMCANKPKNNYCYFTFIVKIFQYIYPKLLYKIL